MAVATREAVEEMFRTLERRDLTAALNFFTEDAVLFDPHYPKPEMRGRAEIEKGLVWGLSVMKQFGFTVRKFLQTEDGSSVAVEVDTHHVLKTGQELKFPQMFIADFRGGKISGLRAYEPYGPNGIGGLFLGIERLKRRLWGKR